MVREGKTDTHALPNVPPPPVSSPAATGAALALCERRPEARRCAIPPPHLTIVKHHHHVSARRTSYVPWTRPAIFHRSGCPRWSERWARRIEPWIARARARRTLCLDFPLISIARTMASNSQADEVLQRCAQRGSKGTGEIMTIRTLLRPAARLQRCSGGRAGRSVLRPRSAAVCLARRCRAPCFFSCSPIIPNRHREGMGNSPNAHPAHP